MKPPSFVYLRPGTAVEVLTLLDRHGDEAKLLAGGQSLVPLMNFRMARSPVIIDINAVEGFDQIRVDEGAGEVVVGALVRQSDAERSAVIRSHCPLLAEALRHVGHRTIRNRGTVGGSLAHADPAAEIPLVLVTLGGRVRLASVSGERWVSASEFFVSELTTVLAPNELLVEARFPITAREPGSGWGFEEFSRRRGDFAMAAAAVTLHLRSDGTIDRCGVGLSGCAGTPIRATDVERGLVGRALDAATAREAAAAAIAGCSPSSDIHGSADFRRTLVSAVVRRALIAAQERALANTTKTRGDPLT